MQQRGHANSDVFAQSGVPFEDIVGKNACGGVGAVERYLVARRRILLRDMSQTTARGEDPANYVRVLAAIDRGLELLARLTEPVEDRQDQ